MAAAIGVREDWTSADLRRFAPRSDDADHVSLNALWQIEWLYMAQASIAA